MITTQQLPDEFTAFSEEDELVLLSEGVYLCSADIAWLEQFATAHLLRDDLVMRGLSDHSDKFNKISTSELVQLVLKHEKSITW